MLVITHYNRLLTELRPDRVHVLANGRIAAVGGPELAEQLEETGYGEYVSDEPALVSTESRFASGGFDV